MMCSVLPVLTPEPKLLILDFVSLYGLVAFKARVSIPKKQSEIQTIHESQNDRPYIKKH